MYVGYILLTLILVTAVVIDMRSWRVPNKLNLCGAAAGAITGMVTSGLEGLASWSIGLVSVLALAYIAYRFKVFGAGDAKLLAVIGGFLGVRAGVTVFLLSMLVAAIPALILRLMHKKRMHFAWPMAVAAIIYMVWDLYRTLGGEGLIL